MNTNINKNTSSPTFKLSIVGSEILNGYIIDTNSKYFTEKLYSLGYEVEEIRILRDDPQEILKTWKKWIAQGDFIITTGGLGPTEDDLTVDLLCELLKTEPTIDVRSEIKLRDYFESRFSDLDSPALQKALRQCRYPKNCDILKNRVGLAPGVYAEKIKLFAVPGFPVEIKGMWQQIENILKKLDIPKKKTRIFPVWGLGEAAIASQIDIPKNIEFGVHALPLGSKIFLKELFSDNNKQENLSLEKFSNILNKKFEENIVDNPLEKFIEFCLQNKLKLGTIESCTGGLAAKLITDISGVSEVFQGSVVTYSNEIKENLLGVNKEISILKGAVSFEISTQMVEKGLEKLNCDICLSTTGIAGPSGGTKEKPVGTVYVSIGTKNEILTGKFFYPMGRERFRIVTSYTAFYALYLRYVFFKDKNKFLKSEFGKNFTDAL